VLIESQNHKLHAVGNESLEDVMMVCKHPADGLVGVEQSCVACLPIILKKDSGANVTEGAPTTDACELILINCGNAPPANIKQANTAAIAIGFVTFMLQSFSKEADLRIQLRRRSL
jgi:hypothetical protein